MRLGLPLLGALMTERGHDVRIYAESLSEVDWERVLSSDLVGISTTTSTAIRAYRYAQKVRDNGIPVIMGGPHVTFLDNEARTSATTSSATKVSRRLSSWSTTCRARDPSIPFSA